MADTLTERRLLAQPDRLLQSDGGQYGQIELPSTFQLYVKQHIRLKSTTQSTKYLEIKRVVDDRNILVGSPDKNIEDRQDVSAFTVADGARIEIFEQTRPVIPPKEHENAVYAMEPIMAKRVVNVDPFGNFFTTQNPMPVQLSDGSLNIESLEQHLAVQLSHKDDVPNQGAVADSVRIGDGEDILGVNPDGSIAIGENTLQKRVDVENNIKYVGFANPGVGESEAKWQISRIVTQNDGDLHRSWADGGSFTQKWTDRKNLFPTETQIEFFKRDYEKLLPLLFNANWMNLANFDQVTPSFSGDKATIDYFESGANIATATVTFFHELNWDIKLERYINQADGSKLLGADGEPLLLG